MAGPVVRASSQADDNCPICYETFSNDIFKTPCNHKFDSECINNWITEKSKGGAFDVPCPLCRRVIIPKNSIHPEFSHIRRAVIPVLPAPRPAPAAARPVPQGQNSNSFSWSPIAPFRAVGSPFTDSPLSAETVSVLDNLLAPMRVFSQLPPLNEQNISKLREFLNREVTVESPLHKVTTNIRSILDLLKNLSAISTNLETHIGTAANGAYGPSRDRGPAEGANYSVELVGGPIYRNLHVLDVECLDEPHPLHCPDHNLYEANPSVS